MPMDAIFEAVPSKGQWINKQGSRQNPTLFVVYFARLLFFPKKSGVPLNPVLIQ